MNAPPLSWTALQRHQGSDFLQWLQDRQALRTQFSALTSALRIFLDDYVRTREVAREIWAAVPAVMSRCNDPATFCLPRAALAYSWLHLPDRYVRTWLALEQLVEARLLPMGKHGVRALDVGTGPGPSAFATHDFYSAMVEYADFSGSEGWRQPTEVTCVECAGEMNHVRHNLAEILCMQGTSESVIAMCSHIPDFGAFLPTRERSRMSTQLRNEVDEYRDEETDEWHSDQVYTPEEANYIANTLHRYRLFTFSNFFTETSTINSFRSNLVDILTDARPGSVLLLLGGTHEQYPTIYRDMTTLAKETGFTRKVERLSVSCSDVGMDEAVYAEGIQFFRKLRSLIGDLADEDPNARKVVRHFEGTKRLDSSTSAVHAYRK